MIRSTAADLSSHGVTAAQISALRDMVPEWREHATSALCPGALRLSVASMGSRAKNVDRPVALPRG